MPAAAAAAASAPAERRPSTESSPLRSSPRADFAPSWTKEGAHSNVSPLLVTTRGLQSSPSPGLAVGTRTVASATSPPSEVPPEKLYVPQVPHDLDTAMYGTGTTAYKDIHHAPRFTATDTLIQKLVTPAAEAAADATDVLAEPGWLSRTAGQQPGAVSFAVSASDALPNIEFGCELGSEQGKDHWTDADLSNISAVFMGEQGRAWREAVEEDELL